MEFGFAFMRTDHVSTQFAFITKIENYLEFELKGRHYGDGVVDVIYGIACGGPLSDAWRDTPTGTVFRPRYTKSKRMLELTVSLSYNEVKSASDDELIDIVKRGLLKTYDAVKSLKIKDFDIDAFYRDLDELLSDREWLKHPTKYRKAPRSPILTSQKKIPPELKLDYFEFWDLIQESLDESAGDTEVQLNLLVDKLVARNEHDIIGFELALREELVRGYDYNVMGLLKAIDGWVTDDRLLYFRCRLILYGRELFWSVLSNPNALTRKLDNDPLAEYLLDVADRAFMLKFGDDTDKDFPRQIGNEYINYNTDAYPMSGIPWEPEDFTRRFARLLELYS